jgi:glutaredoxin
MPMKLHRCPHTWANFGKHPCWVVQKALDEEGVQYEVVKEPWPIRSRRTAVSEGTGQSGVPAIELEDGTWYREESADMAKAIRAGKFGTPAAPPATDSPA